MQPDLTTKLYAIALLNCS